VSEAPPGSVWALGLYRLAAAGDRLTTMMRDRGESADNTDVYVTLLGALMDAYLTRVCGDPDFPTFVPCCGFFQRTGSPNPDAVYRRAPIDAGGTYRLTGERGTAWQVTVMPFAEPSMRSFPPFDLSDVARGPNGAVDVILSRERPAAYTGDWWPLEPGMASLWLRSVSDQWGAQSEPRVAITRLDAPSRPRPPSGAVGEQLASIAARVERVVEYGVHHVDELASEGFVNKLKLVDYGASGGMPLQWYHEGVFDLADDETLLVEARLPEDCTYFSWSLTDRMLVTLDWVHACTSLNRSQATLDDDGVLRVVVAGKDPGVRNWMDTTGYRTGVLQCREIGSTQPSTITSRVVPLQSLDDHLSASTERCTLRRRAEQLRERRTGAQLRHLW
jgi:hypothetical protein